MNWDKLKRAEERFFLQYPEGFSDPTMLEIAKKHKVEKMNKLAQDSFALEQFKNPDKIVDSMRKIISQSSLISLFEKPKFRDVANSFNENEIEGLSIGLREFLHGDQENGFNIMVDIFTEYRLANWPLMTVCPVYFAPSIEVFVKPTTAKAIISYFELEGLKYSPKPSFEFYKGYREHINLIKKEVNGSLNHDNAAFCGFLMMSIENSNG